jgi:hypothetical protein
MERFFQADTSSKKLDLWLPASQSWCLEYLHISLRFPCHTLSTQKNPAEKLLAGDAENAWLTLLSFPKKDVMCNKCSLTAYWAARLYFS